MAITVEFEELAGSPSEQYTSSGFTAVQRFKCKWSQRHNLARQLKAKLGAVYGPNNAARVTDVAIEPFFADEGKVVENPNPRQIVYSDALVTVTYRTPDGYSGAVDSDDPETLISEDVDHWTEFLTLPGRQLWWGKNLDPDFVGPQLPTRPLGDDASPGMLVQGMNWKITRYNVLSVPQAWRDLSGYVNSDQMYSKTLKMTFEPETLLYQPMSMQRVITSEGLKAWTVTQIMSHRLTGWNKFYRARSGTWESVYDGNVDKEGSDAQLIKIYTPTTFKDKLNWK